MTAAVAPLKDTGPPGNLSILIQANPAMHICTGIYKNKNV